jgi:hypothetical protein
MFYLAIARATVHGSISLSKSKCLPLFMFTLNNLLILLREISRQADSSPGRLAIFNTKTVQVQ